MIITTKNGKPYMSSCHKVMPLKRIDTNSLKERAQRLAEKHKKSLKILEESDKRVNGTS